MPISKSKLEAFLLNHTNIEAASYFGVSIRTIIRYKNIRKNWHKNKITRSQAFEIRELYEDGVTQMTLAKRYKVSQKTISNIVNNKTHKPLCDLGMHGSADVIAKYHYEAYHFQKKMH